MTLDEYKNLKPGTRVVATIKSQQVRGMMGNAYSGDGMTPVFKSDSGAMVFITKELVGVFELELLN